MYGRKYTREQYSLKEFDLVSYMDKHFQVKMGVKRPF